jgi:hypothetical protein
MLLRCAGSAALALESGIARPTPVRPCLDGVPTYSTSSDAF